MRSSAGFFHYGPGTLLDCLYPNEMAGVPMQGCRFALLLDRVSTCAIKLKHDRRDHLQYDTRPALNTAQIVAALLTLSGVSSVVMNQWDTTAEENAARLMRIFPVLQDGEEGGIGKAVSMLLGPKPAAAAALADGAAAAAGGKPKSAKKEKKKKAEPVSTGPQPPRVYQPAGVRLNTVIFGLPHIVAV
jgi:hypothetical protein